MEAFLLSVLISVCLCFNIFDVKGGEKLGAVSGKGAEEIEEAIRGSYAEKMLQETNRFYSCAITPIFKNDGKPDENSYQASMLREGIANYYGLSTANVELATGSTPLLQGSVRAFCDAEKAFVTPMPTYSTSLSTAREIDARAIELSLDSGLGVDLDTLAANASGAGLLYLCNPNNPTGTVHGPQVVERFVRRVMRENPDTYVHIDEAYINYCRPGAIETAVPLAMEFEKVFITRSFSKAHGMAGLRVGYALGQEQTLEKIRNAWGMGDVNMLAAVAALTALEDKEHIAWEAQENAEIRDEVIGFFRSRGYEVPDSNTNHIFVNLGMPAAKFREGCLEHKVLVGRDFPPLEQTHCRISLGSREEMKIALEVFSKALA